MTHENLRKNHAYPAWLTPPALLAALFVITPFIAIIWFVPWSNFFHIASANEVQDALYLSLKTCLVSTIFTLILGVPLAIILARSNKLWAYLMRIFILLPMVLPPVVAGLALLLTWGRRGIIGYYLDFAGISISFTTLAVIVAQIFVSLPFFVISFESAIRTQGDGYERAGYSLGASSNQIFVFITLPVFTPALFSSAALACARSLGEFGATITFAGSLQGVTRTMPLQIYLQRELDTDQALALALILLFLAVVMLIFAHCGKYYWTLTHLFTSLLPHHDFSTIKNNHQKQSSSATAPKIFVDAKVDERKFAATVNFPAHSITALMGGNGSGKTTLLHLISGHISPSQGNISFNTHNQRVILLDQNPLLFPHLNIRENVEFGLRRAGVPRQQARQRAISELQKVDLTNYAEHDPRKLSGGQAQRVAFARAMALDPDVVLLDEPFAALDETTTDLLRAQLRSRLSEAQVTAIIVTHNRFDAEYLADQIVTLRHGKIYSKEAISH